MALPELLRSIADLIEEEKANEAKEDRYSGENVGCGPEEVTLPTVKPIYDDDGKQIGDYEEETVGQSIPYAPPTCHPFKPFSIPGLILKHMRASPFREFTYAQLSDATELTKRQVIPGIWALKKAGWVSKYKDAFTLSNHG